MTLEEQRDVIQAAIDGKEIEYNLRGYPLTHWSTWHANVRLFNFAMFDYRVVQRKTDDAIPRQCPAPEGR